MMDALARARTLGVIVDRMTSLAEQSSGPADGSESPPDRSSIAGDQWQRQPHDRGRSGACSKVVEAPLPRDRAGLMPGGRIVITDDGRGVAAQSRKPASGGRDPGGANRRPEEPVDWTSPSAIDSVARPTPVARSPGGDRPCPAPGKRVRRRADRDRLVSPRRRRGEGALPAGESHGRRPGKRRAARGSVPDRRDGPGRALRQRGLRQPRVLPRPRGIAGLVKTLAREWPAVRCSRGRLRAERPDRNGRRPVGRRGVRERRLGRGGLRPGAAGSACGPIESPLAHARLDARAEAGRARADLRRSPRHHRPGRRPSWHGSGGRRS